MTVRLLLISPPAGRALREARFDDGTPLAPADLTRAREAAPELPPYERLLTAPSARCRQTAGVFGRDAVEVPELAGLDAGRWRGRPLAEVSAAEPDAVAAWLSDPAAAPHGGESVRELCARVTGWLESAGGGRTLAVVEPEIVRALVLTALNAPGSAFWRIDVPPLTATELTGRAGRWNVRVGRAL
ncbi:histidine phosphatase family protein [Streptomyces sp. SDr-06]|uniref:histidine phosphatase family protein n=1 Tax=Streptomyces sp. SDr-06 TaxID=2267702 RepID=UPI000DEAB2E3|nr:histidine phosphatase family protein [Streptomyces sp. SDr-06]RCH64396.1 histidine phosphatase family protein [Streptomyces sp. SDr-06]